MEEKAMVADALVGVNGELKMFGDMIPQTEDKELKQCLKQGDTGRDRTRKIYPLNRRFQICKKKTAQ